MNEKVLEVVDYEKLSKGGENGTFEQDDHVYGTASALARLISAEKGEEVSGDQVSFRLVLYGALPIKGLTKGGILHDFYTLEAARAALIARPVKKRGPRT